MKLAQTEGIIAESLMPYPNPVRYPSKSWFLNELEKHPIKTAPRVKFQSVYRVTSYEDVLAWLTSKAGFISLGIPWGVTVDSQGRCLTFTPGSGGHAIAVVGIAPDRLDEDGKPCVMIANSWGDKWGDRGYFYVGKRWWNQALAHRYTVAIACSDIKLPTPQRHSFRKNPVDLKGGL
jgi:hypothetical protein